MKAAAKDRVTAVAISSRGKKKKAAGAPGEGEELDESQIDDLEDGGDVEVQADVEVEVEAEDAE